MQEHVKVFGLYLVIVCILALALLGSGYFIGQGLRAFRTSDRSVTVKGLAEREVKADLAIWPIRFTATSDDLAQAQEKVEQDRSLIMRFLKTQGLAEDDMRPGRITVNDLLAQAYRPQGILQNRFIVKASVDVRTTKVDVVEAIGRKTGDLVKKGVVLSEYQSPSYSFTKLNEIKPEMIATATANAREAALKFAKDSESRLGKIKEARQGIFSILPLNEASGEPASEQIEKKVRVVSTIEYFLLD